MVLDDGPFADAVGDPNALADLAVDQMAARSDDRSLTDRGVP
jgi:hypothetical protein